MSNIYVLPTIDLDIMKNETWIVPAHTLTQGDSGYAQKARLLASWNSVSYTLDQLTLNVAKPDGNVVSVNNANHQGTFKKEGDYLLITLPAEATQAPGQATCQIVLNDGKQTSTTKWAYYIMPTFSSADRSISYVQDMEGLVDDFKGVIVSARQAISDIQGVNKDVSDELNTVEKDASDQFSKWLNDFEADSTTAVEAKKKELDGIISDCMDKFNRLSQADQNYDKQAQAAIDAATSKINQEWAKMKSDLQGKVNDELSTLEGQLGTLKDTLDGLDTREGDLSTQITTLNDKLGTIKDNLSDYALKSEVYTRDEIDAKLKDFKPTSADTDAIKSVSVNGGSPVLPDKQGNANINVPDPDLSDYAKKSDIPAPIDTSDYAKKEDLTKYITSVSIDGNDGHSWYLTPIPGSQGIDIDLPEMLKDIHMPDYATKDDIKEAASKDDLKGYFKKLTITTTDADGHPTPTIEDAKTNNGQASINLMPYAKKSDLSNYAKTINVTSKATGDTLIKNVQSNQKRISTLENSQIKQSDLDDIRSKANNAIPEIIDSTGMPLDKDKWNRVTLPSFVRNSELTNYAKKSDIPAPVDTSSFAKKSDLNSYAKYINVKYPNGQYTQVAAQNGGHLYLTFDKAHGFSSGGGDYYEMIPDGAPSHNQVYRGKEIPFSTDTEKQTFFRNVSTGTFKDIFLGDYIKIQGPFSYNKFVIVAFDYYGGPQYTTATVNGRPNQIIPIHYVTLMPDQMLRVDDSANNSTNPLGYNVQMFDGDPKLSGFAKSKVFSETLPKIDQYLNDTFGSNHIMPIFEQISNNFDGSTNSSDTDSAYNVNKTMYSNVPTMSMIFGTNPILSDHNNYPAGNPPLNANEGYEFRQLPITRVAGLSFLAPSNDSSYLLRNFAIDNGPQLVPLTFSPMSMGPSVSGFSAYYKKTVLPFFSLRA